MNPPKKNFAIKEGPSTNVEASAQDRQTSRTPGCPCSGSLPTCSPESPDAALTTPGGTSARSSHKDNPRQGRPLHHILSILHASQSQAEGVTGGSCLGEWAAASLPWEPLISGLCGGLSSHPGCPSTDRLRKGHERGPGLLSVVDHDPGKYHLAFLCVF